MEGAVIVEWRGFGNGGFCFILDCILVIFRKVEYSTKM
jgi:hypothetical protein